MNLKHFLWQFCVYFSSLNLCATKEKFTEDPGPPSSSFSEDYAPKVVLVLLVRNKAHALPHFLAFIDLLEYPKDRISLFIRSDHNVDNSTGLLKEWIRNVIDLYDVVDYSFNDTKGGYEDEMYIQDWPDQRFQTLMNLREEALTFCKKIQNDYIFYVDTDNLLENPKVLKILMRHEKSIIAPSMRSYNKHKNYWWGIMDDDYYLNGQVDPAPGSMELFLGKTTGVFEVPNLHSTFLINMRDQRSHLISFLMSPQIYDGPFDDVFIFGFNNRKKGIKMWMTNEEFFGTLPDPPDADVPVQAVVYEFNMIKVKRLFDQVPPMPISKHVTLPKQETKTDKLGLDEIYVITHERRPHRWAAMQYQLQLMGMDAKLVTAFDPRTDPELTSKLVGELGIRMAPNFLLTSKFKKAKMRKKKKTRQENSLPSSLFFTDDVGSFLSHFRVWEDIVAKGHQQVLILEDDVVFEPNFRSALEETMQDLNKQKVYWELIHLEQRPWSRGDGDRDRDEPIDQDEDIVYATEHLLWADYSDSSYSLSYMLSYKGAKKLYSQQPLSKIVPVDVYLAIMNDKYGNRNSDDLTHDPKLQIEIKKLFSPRDLVAMGFDHVICRRFREEEDEEEDEDEHDLSHTDDVMDVLSPSVEPSTLSKDEL